MICEFVVSVRLPALIGSRGRLFPAGCADGHQRREERFRRLMVALVTSCTSVDPAIIRPGSVEEVTVFRFPVQGRGFPPFGQQRAVVRECPRNIAGSRVSPCVPLFGGDAVLVVVDDSKDIGPILPPAPWVRMLLTRCSTAINVGPFLQSPVSIHNDKAWCR